MKNTEHATMIAMAEIAQVKDVMTRDVLTVGPDDSLELAAQLFAQYDYDGVPVVGSDRKLLGIITAYDMVAQSSGMHLPTLLNIMQKIKANKADQKELSEHFTRLRHIKVKQFMNPEPLTVASNVSIDVAAELFAQHHRVNPLPVIDEYGALVGVLSRYDVIKFFNESYFRQILGKKVEEYVAPYRSLDHPIGEREVEKAVGEISQEFLFVTKKRPRIWRFVAIAAFLAGLVAATALIIRIVQKGS